MMTVEVERELMLQPSLKYSLRVSINAFLPVETGIPATIHLTKIVGPSHWLALHTNMRVQLFSLDVGVEMWR